MNIKEIIQRLKTAMDDARGQESHFESWLTQNEGICDAIDALKELDKTEQEPVQYKFSIGCRACGHLESYDMEITLPTTPPQRTWVGLTDDEMWQLVNDCTIGGDLHADKFAKAIEAKLKAKNERKEKNT
jgi:hypothetical protein